MQNIRKFIVKRIEKCGGTANIIMRNGEMKMIDAISNNNNKHNKISVI